jgi:hypothetical protein
MARLPNPIGKRVIPCLDPNAVKYYFALKPHRAIPQPGPLPKRHSEHCFQSRRELCKDCALGERDRPGRRSMRLASKFGRGLADTGTASAATEKSVILRIAPAEQDAARAPLFHMKDNCETCSLRNLEEKSLCLKYRRRPRSRSSFAPADRVSGRRFMETERINKETA